MKQIIFLAFGLVSTFGMAVELHLATNSQLLAELDRRLDGGTGEPGATALYTCDSSTRLTVELFSQSGAIKKVDLYIGDQGRCATLSNDLSGHKSKIKAMSLIALCDSSSRLYRYPLRPDGTFGQTTDTYIGDLDRCMAQAKVINTSN